MANFFRNLKKRQFVFEELVKRDFKQKYKRTVLGMFWSVLSPLLTLLVMNLVFSHFFRRGIEHYTTYMFCGNIVFSYYSMATKDGMNALLANASIFTKINVPKYLFLFSKNVSAFINFLLTLAVFFLFALLDGVTITPLCLALVYPVVCLAVFNVGVGLILSALYVFYRDIAYLYDVFTRLLMYCSAIFYSVDRMPARYQTVFMLNPIYVYIKYFRLIVLEQSLPSLNYHLLCAGYALAAFALGAVIYKRFNHRFLYYV